MRFLVSSVQALLLPAMTFAGIGENFEAAGSYVGGSAVFQVTLGSLDAISLSDWQIWLTPSFEFLVVDNLALSVSPSFSLWGVTTPSPSTTWQISASGSLTKYVVGQPEGSTGFVPSVNLSVGLYYRSNDQIGMSFKPGASLDHFLTQRISVRLSLSGFGEGLGIVPGPVFFYSWLSPQVSIGVGYFIPSKDRVLFPAK